MAKQDSFTGILLICLGSYFLLQKVNVSWIERFDIWPTILMIVGISLIIHCYFEKKFNNLFIATLLLGLGIHLHGLIYYDFWIDHWAMYALIVGIAFILRAIRTKKGLLVGIVLVGLSTLLIFSIQMPKWFTIVDKGLAYIEKFWPVLLVITGLYFLRRK